MKTGLFIIVVVMPVIALADDPLPQRPDSNRYQAMLNSSPFALATVAVPTATSDFPKDLYVASTTCFADDCVVTIASVTDKNFKERISTKRPDEHGFRIDNI